MIRIPSQPHPDHPEMQQPAEPLPAAAILIVCTGAEYVCYMPGDELPPEQPVEVSPVPQSITPRQARLILAKYGLLGAINTAVAQIGGTVQIEWEYASEVRRDNPLLGQIARQTGMTDPQLDEMFSEAAVL